MISDIPKESDYKVVGVGCLCESLIMIYKVRLDSGEFLGDCYPGRKEEVWLHNKFIVRTSLILLFQGIETLLKAEICKESPFLLIEDKRKDWPSRPDRNDKDFDAMSTYLGDDLLNTFLAVQNIIELKVDQNKFIELFNELRIIRNSAMHGLQREQLSPEYVVKKNLEFFTLFYGKDRWFIELKNNFSESPFYDYYDKGTTTLMLNNFLNYIQEFTSKNFLSRNLIVDIKRRGYLCPYCYDAFNVISDALPSKWAFITDLNNLKCIVCDNEFEITKSDCINEKCNGNVCYKDYKERYDLCLTCGGNNQELPTTGV